MKILVVRFSSIGDIVLTTPVVRCVKQQLKNCEVHYITKKPFESILASNPFLTKIYSIEKEVSEVIPQLKKENYDFIIDLHHNLRSARLKSALGKRSASFTKLNIEKWLMVNLKWNKLPEKHIVERYLEAVKSLGIVNDRKGLDYFIPEKDVVQLKTLPSEFQNGFVGFVIGAKYLTKQLPVKKIISVINKVNDPVLLLGGKEDFDKGEIIRKNIINKNIFNSCGKYNLNQSASLVQQAKKIITHDTGLMHIAAAFKKEIVSVWGNTIPAFGMYPYYGNSKVNNLRSEVNNLSCRPCSKLGFSECPKKHFKCMNEINAEEIVQFVNSN